MDTEISLLAIVCICVLPHLALGEKTHPKVIIEHLSEEAREEIQSYLSDTLTDIHRVLMGEKFHEAYDFRVDIKPKETQCYYQESEGNKTSLSVDFECVDPPMFGSSVQINARVGLMKDNDGEILASIENKRIGKLEIKAEEPGIYAICFEASDGSGGAKLQIGIDIWKGNNVKQFHDQRIGANDTEYEVFSGLFQIIKHVAVMRSAMSHTKSLLRYDYLTQISNLSRIDNFSIFYAVLIISVCFLQLRIVKKMFDGQSTTT